MRRRQRLGVFLDAVGLGLLLLLDVIQVLEVPRAGAERQLLGDQEVAGISVGDVTHLAPTSDRLATSSSRMTFMLGVLVRRHVRQQGHRAGTLDGVGELALMPRAAARRSGAG